ncbi:type I restriction endonuclease subunit R [Aestuariirhabdus litorea]|uniref:Type I restriction endonuclease subunit R n=1 Tax=Aestuariirhabdus litorea TaxID=2528527 RepID=A0A3P3VIQ2_9GAMM|nr:DEAD/DEAH box helicase family protein [Aestuariirhabdus litorea]RRJ82600.1 type I restriction endonuclease subunit R [Aestuariirhabdus litorea]RWW92759.1 DEAD/DEAH box helicase [Endozoicomonadaceae bacterium GTF-13]
MSDAKALELTFQNHIIAELEAQGWLVGNTHGYDRERALYPEDLIAYVQATQPDNWQKFCKIYGSEPEKHLLNAAVRGLDRKGTLWLLRNQIEDRGVRLKVATFKPDHELNPELSERYRANRLRVVPELIYSPHEGNLGRIDLALFLNGLPVATLELKSCFKQSLENAKKQYRYDRKPRTNGKDEPLLKFKRGAIVHFAVNQFEVAMTTKLAGKDTFFLPFNRGTKAGGAGNDQPEDGYATEYLWRELFQRDNLLKILHRYVHLEQKESFDELGRIKTKETMIFPRYHQWAVVQKLLDAAKMEGTGKKYLIQHSAGSGKSNSIAWLAHQASSLCDAAGEKLFNSVIVITDRTVLDNQLQETISQFEHASGVVSRINREEGDGSKSAQLTEALASGTPIIIVTIQTFPNVLTAIQESSGLKERTFAVIADEAHSSQTGSTARKLRQVLMAEEQNDERELSAEDVMNATLAARGGSDRISYFAFTATPKAKTLELFGRPDDPTVVASNDNPPRAFHVYSMRQAIEEGFILDVLKNYTSYSMAYRLAMTTEAADQEVDSKKAKTRLNTWIRLHPHNIGQKVQVIVEHFRSNISPLLAGEAKAMVVTSSRKEAVRYKLAFDKYIREKGYEKLAAMVAFSGEVIDKESGPEPFTEKNMNPGLKGRDMRKAFDTDDYQLMLVANKFQTGFDQPKLCAMYVDKKLTGVDCIQTLSRLNRTYPGKESTYVLDFVNEPEDILGEFQPYYEVAELDQVSDPNLVYDLFHKLRDNSIINWHEVVALADAYFDPKRGAHALTGYIKPSVDRFVHRYRHANETLREARAQMKEAARVGSETEKVNAERCVKEAEENRNSLDLFKKDVQSFIRFYEFISQIVPFDDSTLEQMNVFCRHLLPLLHQEVIEEDEIDLSSVVLSHYNLKYKRTQDLKLREEHGEYLSGITGVGTATAREQEKDLLSQILSKINELMGIDITQGDGLDWWNGMATKMSENKAVMDQVHNNTDAAVMNGDFPRAMDEAVIERMDTQQEMSMKYLGSTEVAKEVQTMMLRWLREQLGEARR